MGNYDLLKKLIDENPERVNFGPFGEGASDEWISLAQKRLNVTFPPSYIWWLKNYAGGEIFGDEIFSIYDPQNHTLPGGDIIYRNELDRKNGFLKNNELLIQTTDYGEWYYLDLNQTDENGENPVYNQTNQKKYADSFLDFLKKKMGGS